MRENTDLPIHILYIYYHWCVCVCARTLEYVIVIQELEPGHRINLKGFSAQGEEKEENVEKEQKQEEKEE